MRWWCPVCNSEYVSDVNWNDTFDCNCDQAVMRKIPDFETPSQYEKRTGKKWNGAVWLRKKEENNINWSKWAAFKFPPHYRAETQIVCAASPVPPPDDYVPEVEA